MVAGYTFTSIGGYESYLSVDANNLLCKVGCDAMRIEHLALWTNQLEIMKEFYCKYFEGKASKKYMDKNGDFESYFIAFDDGSRLELMYTSGIVEQESYELIAAQGLTHFAIEVGSELMVRRLTERIKRDGYTVTGGLRYTNEGYLESVILDPDGNCIELII